MLSPRVHSVAASLARAEDDQRDAFLYSLYAAYPLQSTLLIQAEQSYITISSPEGIEGGFGDFQVRLRARLRSAPGRVLYAFSALRSGSGSRGVFPFASGSIDATFGFSVVDSLSLFSYWGTASTSFVWRAPEGSTETLAHDNFSTITAGITLPLHDAFNVRLFAAGYFLMSGASREILGAVISCRTSSYVNLYATVLAEGGEREERISDITAAAGARIFY
ncbi:MAG: hypothetical protein ABIA59_09835 [Candidatus Latescibacterota bacterium]